MTTNERMNLARYAHFHTNKRGSYNSPFDRGIWQNMVDFVGFRCFGSLRPIKDDWYNRYDTEDLITRGPSNHSEDREPLLRVV